MIETEQSLREALDEYATVLDRIPASANIESVLDRAQRLQRQRNLIRACAVAAVGIVLIGGALASLGSNPTSLETTTPEGPGTTASEEADMPSEEILSATELRDALVESEWEVIEFINFPPGWRDDPWRLARGLACKPGAARG